MIAKPVLIALLLAAALILWLWLRPRLRPRDRLVGLGFLLAVAVVIFFAVRLIGSALYWADPAHQAMPPAPWMSPGLIERSWQLPPLSLAPVIGAPPEDTRGRNLTEIARMRGEPVEALIARITAALPAAPGGSLAAP